MNIYYKGIRIAIQSSNSLDELDRTYEIAEILLNSHFITVAQIENLTSDYVDQNEIIVAREAAADQTAKNEETGKLLSQGNPRQQ